MNSISVYVDDKSNNYKIFSGESTDKKLKCKNVERCKVSNRNDLISNALIKSDENSYILTAFGPLLTTMKTNEIYDAMQFAINNIDFDVLYLTIYADNCDFLSDDRSYEKMVFNRTISPHGTECILISPKGVNRILELINEDDGRGYDFYLNAAANNMKMYRSYPPIMMVDVSKRHQDVQLIKGSVCREQITAVSPIKLTKKYTGNMNLFWFFLIVVFILFLAAMILSFSDKNNYINDQIIVDANPMGKQKIASSMTAYPNVPI